MEVIRNWVRVLGVKLVLILGVSFSGALLSGCAFIDAASFGPNFSRIEVGTKRMVVEQELGQPRTRILGKRGISVDIYEYRVSDRPSRIRAIGNLIKSTFTLGMWEFWSNERTVPYRLRIVYDGKQRVTEIRQVDVFADQVYERANR